MEPIIRQCTCKHDFQDKTYGKGNRLMNVGKEGKLVRCTVCGREYNETVKK